MCEQTEKIRITVFTPAYNRGYIIEKLYRSLQRQTYRDFEWLVVDDGSKDDTELKFAEFQAEENDFSIRYIKTENGGKHRAINRGIREARGELFFIVDSDDYITDDALDWIDKIESSLSEKKDQFCGVCGLKGYSESKMIGDTFAGEILDITTLERPNYGISGDKAEVYYTNILRKYPFPEFEGERFLTECIVWDRIAAAGYKMRFYNRIAIICNYLEDGLTSNGRSLFLKNPKGYGLFLYQEAKYGKISREEQWENYYQYYYTYRNELSLVKMGKNIHINPILLWCGLFPRRVLEKLGAMRNKNDS